MKIGIFVYPIPVSNSGGVARYAQQLVLALAKCPGVETVVFCSPQNKELFQEYAADNVKILVLPGRCKYLRALTNNKIIRKSPFLGTVTKNLFYNPVSRKIMDWLGDYKSLVEKTVDVVHFPYQVLDRYDFTIPTVISLHDLQHKHLPDFFTEEEIRERDASFEKSARLASRIIVSFDHVKKDIMHFYGISPDKIDVCSLVYDIKLDADLSRFPSIQKKYGIPAEYLFYSALTWKHKNHIGLIKALKIVHEKYGRKIHLVCTGAKSGFYSEVKKQIDESGLEKYITFTGFVSDEELKILVSKARLVVIPTFYEAGSYPLLEAMAMGAPVICSNVTALPGQIGDPRFIFNPNDTGQMAEKIYQMITDEKLRQENVENSKKQMAASTWEKNIVNFTDSYQKAVEK